LNTAKNILAILLLNTYIAVKHIKYTNEYMKHIWYINYIKYM